MPRTLTLLAALVGFSALSFAQTTFATITGTVTDPTGLPLAGAKVSAVHLETGFAATNVLNHPNWGNPGLTITSLASAGVISSTQSGGGGLDPSGARACRMGLRLEW
jgi:hypothetical protein